MLQRNRTSREDKRYTNNDQHGVDVSTNNSLNSLTRYGQTDDLLKLMTGS